MKNKIITSLLLSSLSLLAYDSIYDGTGSLIHPLISDTEIQAGLSWGANKDQADMQPHIDKTSTVTFQVLHNETKCNHIDIHSNYDLDQKVKINLKSWSDESIQESYLANLPVGKFSDKDGISIDVSKNNWTTLSITTTKPITQTAEIYAYCRNSSDTKNIVGLEKVSPEMTRFNSNYVYMGNGSLINRLTTDNRQWGYGIKKDEAVASNSTYNAETMFQIQSSDECKEVMIKDNGNSTEVENILFKKWNEADWHQSNCASLPCELNTLFKEDGSSDYMLVKIKTKKGENDHLEVKCGAKEVKIELNEKATTFKNINSCEFDDVSTDNINYKYITALCSAQIFEGDEDDNYQNFKPNQSIKWGQFVEIVNLANNFYKTQEIRGEIDSEIELLFADIFISILVGNDGFGYDLDTPVTNNMALTYFSMIFWDELLEPNEAKAFLQNKLNIISSMDISATLNRGDMAKIVLQLAKISGDNSGVEKELPYLNHKGDLNSDSSIIRSIQKGDMPKSVFEKASLIDNTKEEVAQTISENIVKTKKSNITTSEKDSTDNLGLTKAILGGEDNLKEEFKNKNATEILEESKKTGLIDTNIETTEKEPTIEVFSKDGNVNDTIIVPNVIEKDTKGDNKIFVETKSGETDIVSKDELKNSGYISKGKIKAIDLIQDKSNSIPPTPIGLKSTIKRTGQTTSYSDYDDGYYQAGITPNYLRDDAREVVVDLTNTLIWQDNESVKKPFVTEENYSVSEDQDYSGDTAITYCNNLTLAGFTDWRLPTVKELLDLGDAGRSKPAINPVFKNIELEFYMSSTLYTVLNRNAPWLVSFNSITMTNSPGMQELDKEQYIRCVRENR